MANMGLGICAHRGRLIPNLPGNTLLDFQGVCELGVKWIETDVCFTAPDEDGSQEPIIHHPNPSDCSDPSHIKWKYLKPKLNPKVLSLNNFLAFLKVNSSLSCLLELKEDSDKLVDAVVKKITEYKLENRVYITVFQMRIHSLRLEASARLIARARSQNPKIKIHLIVMFPFSLPRLTHRYHPDIISVGWLPGSKLSTWLFKGFLVNTINLKKQIRKAQEMGVEIIGGIANDRKDFDYLVSLNVDGIMTDDSVAAVKFLKEKSS